MKKTKEYINPEGLFNSTQFGFSQVVSSGPGIHVFISGQVAWDKDLKITGKDDLGKQTYKSLENIALAIQAAGGTLKDIVMLRIYKVNYMQEDGIIITHCIEKVFRISYTPRQAPG